MGIQFPPYCFPLPIVLLYTYIYIYIYFILFFFNLFCTLVKGIITLKLKLKQLWPGLCFQLQLVYVTTCENSPSQSTSSYYKVVANVCRLKLYFARKNSKYVQFSCKRSSRITLEVQCDWSKRKWEFRRLVNLFTTIQSIGIAEVKLFSSRTSLDFSGFLFTAAKVAPIELNF